MSSLRIVTTLTNFYVNCNSCASGDAYLEVGDFVIVIGTNSYKDYEIMCITRFGIGFIHDSHAR